MKINFISLLYIKFVAVFFFLKPAPEQPASFAFFFFKLSVSPSTVESIKCLLAATLLREKWKCDSLKNGKNLFSFKLTDTPLSKQLVYCKGRRRANFGGFHFMEEGFFVADFIFIWFFCCYWGFFFEAKAKYQTTLLFWKCDHCRILMMVAFLSP